MPPKPKRPLRIPVDVSPRNVFELRTMLAGAQAVAARVPAEKRGLATVARATVSVLAGLLRMPRTIVVDPDDRLTWKVIFFLDARCGDMVEIRQAYEAERLRRRW